MQRQALVSDFTRFRRTLIAAFMAVCSATLIATVPSGHMPPLADAGSLPGDVEDARVSVTVDSVTKWETSAPHNPKYPYSRALSIAPAFPSDLPGFRCHTPESCGPGVYILYRRMANGAAWQAVALSRERVFRPGQELSWSASAIPHRPYVFADPDGPLPFTKYVFDLVTTYPCHSLVATVSIGRANGKRLLSIGAIEGKDPNHPCLPYAEAEKLLQGPPFPFFHSTVSRARM